MLQTTQRILEGLSESIRTDAQGHLIPGQHDPHLAEQTANLLHDPQFFKKVAGDEFYRAPGKLTGEQAAKHLGRGYTDPELKDRTDSLPQALRKPRRP